jgi:hypothetical protein
MTAEDLGNNYVEAVFFRYTGSTGSFLVSNTLRLEKNNFNFRALDLKIYLTEEKASLAYLDVQKN